MTRDAKKPSCYLADHGYEHDIFISYAHGPKDARGNAPLKNWSAQFRDLLESNLQMYGIVPVGLWFDDSADHDRRLDSLEGLDEQFARLIKTAAMLQVHVSEHYLASDWCKQELACWVESLPGKPGAKDRRISVIRATDTMDSPWPGALAPNRVQLPGDFFHGPGDQVPWGFNLDWKGSAPAANFSAAMINVAAVISRRLKELKRELDQRKEEKAQVEALASGNPGSIYLHGRFSREAAWNQTRKELQGLGLEVRPLSPAPDDDEDQAWTSLTKIASRCQAMLLLGADQYELDDDLDAVGRDKRGYIQAHFQRYLPCAVVDRKGIRSDAFLDAARIRGIDWLDATKRGWQGEVPRWLARAATTTASKYGVGPGPEPPPAPTEGGGG